VRKSKNKKHHYILILFFIVIAVFSIYEEFGKDKKPKVPPPPPSKPKVAIIMDDLGPNKETAIEIMNLNNRITLSILPQQTYSSWIAGEGRRRGHDIIAHIPMEALSAQKPGEGGLFTWMTDGEIVETFDKDIKSVPHALGISNHMGSAFTRDERAMRVVLAELKKRKLFFLDSLTTPDSTGYELAKAGGTRALRRDLFLDDKDAPAEIEAQWKKLLQLADKNGRAILLAHPRRNTIEFLRKTLKDNKEIEVVPVRELIAESG